MLVVVALWLAGGGLTAVHSGGEALTSLGRLTGLVASDLLLVQVLLMARIPLVERPTARTSWPGATGWSASRRST